MPAAVNPGACAFEVFRPFLSEAFRPICEYKLLSSPTNTPLETSLHELLDAMRPQDGSSNAVSPLAVCPVCTLTQRSVERQIRALFAEFVNDPASRIRFRQARGFCSHHTPLLLELGDALAVAILYADLAARTQDQWQAAPGRRLPFGKKTLRYGAPLAPCPACAAEKDAEQRYTQALAAGLEREESEEVWTRVAASSGLCVAHVERVLTAASPAAAIRLRALELRRLAQLQAELEEIVRKNDYRFRGEAWGAERDAWQRALLKLSRPGE